MSNEIEQLARRAVACPGWQWVPGMRVVSDPAAVPRPHGLPVVASDLAARIYAVVIGRWFGVHEYSSDFPDAEGQPCEAVDLPGCMPDLTDPATLGAAADLVRAHLAKMADRDEARRHGLRVALAWQEWFRGQSDKRALVMVEALEAATVCKTQAREEKSCPA